MGKNKIIFGGETLIDLTTDTLTSSNQLLNGVTAHGKNGDVITGSLEQWNIETKSVTVSSASTSFTITGLRGEPKAFMLQIASNITLASTRYVISASSNGTTRRVQYAYKSGNNGYAYQSTSYLTATYSNGSLTLKTSSSTNGGNFYRGTYSFIYIY